MSWQDVAQRFQNKTGNTTNPESSAWQEEQERKCPLSRIKSSKTWLREKSCIFHNVGRTAFHPAVIQTAASQHRKPWRPRRAHTLSPQRRNIWFVHLSCRVVGLSGEEELGWAEPAHTLRHTSESAAVKALRVLLLFKCFLGRKTAVLDWKPNIKSREQSCWADVNHTSSDLRKGVIDPRLWHEWLIVSVKARFEIESTCWQELSICAVTWWATAQYGEVQVSQTDPQLRNMPRPRALVLETDCFTFRLLEDVLTARRTHLKVTSSSQPFCILLSKSAI